MTTAAVETEFAGYALSAAEFQATVEKIAKINARAEKRGFTGRLGVTGTREERTSVNEAGINVTEIVYVTKVVGDAPVYNGWVFEARIDRVGETFTIATAPGVDHVDRSLVHAGVCDHCGFNRRRNNTYLVRNIESGEIVNVGSTCIKDFLGWSASVVFFSDEDVNREIEGFFGTGERSYSVDTILATAYAAMRAFGWVPSSSYDGRPTVSYVWLALGGQRLTNDQDRADVAKIAAYAAEANGRAATIREFILSDDFAGISTYVDNLKVAASLDYVTGKQMGLLASAPRAYTRHLETQAEREAKAAAAAAAPVSEFIGSVKDKVVVEGTITSINFLTNPFGTTVLYTIHSTEGNVVKWFASREALGTEEGVAVKIQGTVKGHEEYRGQKQTMLTRCKAL